MKDLLDPKLLRSFALVLRTGSYSSAAKELGITQPAVSLRMRQLEQQLGVRLVERSSGRLQATEAGVLLMTHIPRIDAAHRCALEALASNERTRESGVSLGAGLTACLHFLPAVLGRMNVTHPEIKVSVVSGNSTDCARQVAQGTLDLGIVTMPVSDTLLLKTTVLHDELMAIAATGMSMKARMASTDFRAGHLLLLNRSTNSRKAIDQWRESDTCADPVMEFDCVETIKELVACGLGYGVVPRISLLGVGARQDLHSASLRPPLRQTWVIIARKDKPASRSVDALRDALVLAGSAAG